MSRSVRLEPSQRTFSVADGETVLAAGLRQGFALPFGCQTGGCGSCRVHLTAGHIETAERAGLSVAALSQGEIDAGYVLMCLAHPLTDLTLRLHQPEMLDQLRPRALPVRAAEHRPLSHDVMGLWVTLPRAEGAEAFRYLPRQYVDFILPDHRRRSFSIANAAWGGKPLEFHLRVTPGGFFANWVREQMRDRAVLRIEGPFGAFYVREDSPRPVVMMAGGTGFAPVKGMIERQFGRGLTRPFHLFWGARAARDLYLDALAREWAQAQPRFRYTPVLSEPDADWRGETGFVHEAVLRAHPDLRGHEAYMAGPPAMVHAAKSAFQRAGLDAGHLYYDSFDYAFETWPKLG